MKHVSLDDIRLFVAVVQAGSLSQASELTGIPVSRLSRRLTQLEHALGTQLVNRGKKGVTLNELGERFFVHTQTMLQHAELAIEDVYHRLDKPSGLLKITSAFDMHYFVLAPYLHEYLEIYPDVNIDISLTQQKINMIQDGVDIALRVGAIENENVVAKTLFFMNFGVFATTRYLEKYGIPQTPHDLYHHKTITQTLTLPWTFFQGQHHMTLSPVSHVSCNDFLLLERMITQGIGIGILPHVISRKHPDLVQVLSDWYIPQVPISLIYYKNRGAIPTIKSFVAWLSEKYNSKSP